ncbi:hypothetical protein ACFFJB_02060 [Camelimonas abortus]|uniref:hypothetical protein n=1 Tax=Camelimonas abortus TaxID=1017184 RepID=UPI0035E9BF41
MQDDDQVDVPVADEPQAEAEQSEVTTETTDEAKTGQEAEADAEGADAAGDDGDEQEDGEKRKRRSGVDRLKRKIAELTAELELQRSRGPVPADSEAIRRAVEAEVGEPPKIEDFEDYFAYERAMTAYEIDRRLAEKEAKRNAAARQAQMTAAQQIALEDFREREAEVAKAIRTTCRRWRRLAQCPHLMPLPGLLSSPIRGHCSSTISRKIRRTSNGLTPWTRCLPRALSGDWRPS